MRCMITGGLLAGLVALPGWAQTETAEPEGEQVAQASYDASTVLATVNGDEITLGHLLVMRQRLPAQYEDLPDDVLFPGLLEQVVDQTLLAQEVGTSEGDPLEVRLHLENERRGALAARAVLESAKAELSETDVQAAYEEAVAGVEAASEYSASHILVESEETAKALGAEIDGDADFAEAAKANSKDGSAATGGELGWFGAGQMVPEFEAAVAELEVGEVSSPVKTQFGWHLIKLNDKREVAPPPLADVRPEIENQLRQQALQSELEQLRSAAQIDLPDTGMPASAISDTSLLGE